MTRTYATDEQYERWFMAECCRCGRRRHKAGTWPDGYVCRTCSDRAVRTRGTCPGRGQDRALPGIRPDDRASICTTCAGFSQTFDCSRCGFEGKLLGGQLLELPAPVVADALGYHHKTTTRLRNETGGTWSRYAPGDHGRSPAGWAPRGTGNS